MRALRGFADGFASVLLAAYLEQIGMSPIETGAIVTATLLGSAALTLGVGLYARHFSPERILFRAALLMLATGVGFAGLTQFWPLMLVAFAGTLNPSAGDVSVFLPTEQALLAGLGTPERRPALFARYNLWAAVLGAGGALASGAPALAASRLGLELELALRLGFLVYTAIAIAIALLYRRLDVDSAAPPTSPGPASGASGAALSRSRRVVIELSALFSLDSFGGGFAVQSLLALWLLRRFDLSLQAAGAVFFVTGLLSAVSQLTAAPIARRIGLVRTMVYTHIPANVLLLGTALAPDLPLALACLFGRAALSQIDVPARQALVMSVVPPEERAAAASITNVPRSLAAALAPLPAGWLLAHSTFGWPLVCAAGFKITYDLLLLLRFGRIETRPIGP